MEKENILRTIYYDQSHPAGFSTAEKLFHAAKEHDNSLTLKEVKDWWSGEFTATLHKPARRHFVRNRILINYIDEQWEADLVDMSEFKNSNNGINYMLTVIDSLSKYAWAIPVKRKFPKDTIEAFKKIFEDKRYPILIRTDQGTEFKNKEFKKFLSTIPIYHKFTANKDVKCAIVERFNGTLKRRMHKYFTANGTRKWINEIESFVNAYNNTIHGAHKMTPIEASKAKSQDLVRKIFGVDDVEELRNKKMKTDFKAGDTIRKAYKKGPFDKSYYPLWEDRIDKVIKEKGGSTKSMYRIEDEKPLFYKEQLQKVNENLYRVERVIEEKTTNNKKKYFVKWVGYPDSYNSWVSEDDMVDLQPSQ